MDRRAVNPGCLRNPAYTYAACVHKAFQHLTESGHTPISPFIHFRCEPFHMVTNFYSSIRCQLLSTGNTAANGDIEIRREKDGERLKSVVGDDKMPQPQRNQPMIIKTLLRGNPCNQDSMRSRACFIYQLRCAPIGDRGGAWRFTAPVRGAAVPCRVLRRCHDAHQRTKHRFPASGSYRRRTELQCGRGSPAWSSPECPPG